MKDKRICSRLTAFTIPLMRAALTANESVCQLRVAFSFATVPGME